MYWSAMWLLMPILITLLVIICFLMILTILMQRPKSEGLGAAFGGGLTDNLFGDILTDIAAAICGGIGLAASGNINPDGTFPSMFEPVHGSAPDIAGKQLADPTATVMSVAMMLEHLGLTDAAADVVRAVEQDLLTRGTTKRSTAAVGDALAALVK